MMLCSFTWAAQAGEVTYSGKEPLPQEQVDDWLRRRDHSIETAVKMWLNDPKTILVYEGQHLVERRLAEQVTLFRQRTSPSRSSWTPRPTCRCGAPSSGATRSTKTKTPMPRSTTITTRSRDSHPLHHHALQERRDDPPVLHPKGDLSTSNCRPISGAPTRPSNRIKK